MQLSLFRKNDDEIPLPQEIAQEMWSAREDPRGSPVDTYLREMRSFRGPIPPAIAFLKPNRFVGHPAMIAAMWSRADAADFGAGDDKSVEAVQITLLHEDGFGTAGTICDRMRVGFQHQEGPILLGALHGGNALGFSADIERGLLLHQYLARPVWCFLNGRPHSIPSQVDHVFVHEATGDPLEESLNAELEKDPRTKIQRVRIVKEGAFQHPKPGRAGR